MLCCSCGTSAETLWEAETQSLSGCLRSRFFFFFFFLEHHLEYLKRFQRRLDPVLKIPVQQIPPPRTVKFVMRMKVNSVYPHVSGFVSFSHRRLSWWTQTSSESRSSRKLWINHTTASKGQKGAQTCEPAEDTGTCTYHGPMTSLSSASHRL